MDPEPHMITFEDLVGMAINKFSNDVKTLVEKSGLDLLDEDAISRFEDEVRRADRRALC
jgi:hypothetical protein